MARRLVVPQTTSASGIRAASSGLAWGQHPDMTVTAPGFFRLACRSHLRLFWAPKLVTVQLLTM